jgi:Xaa-Pro aminopeptidase
MKYAPIARELFIKNRQKLASLLKNNHIAVLNSNDIMPTNADGTMPFRQNSDIFYLSGIDQEESILVLFPDAPLPKFREMLFLKETNEEIEIWEGHKYTQQEATQTSGIENIYWLHEFPTLFHTVMGLCEGIYLNSNEHSRAVVVVETRDARFIKKCKNDYPLHQYERLAPLMAHLRMIKSDIEIEMLQKACDITEKGFRRVLPFIKPNVMEYEIEAEYIHEFVRNRSKGFAYTPIIASGYNACVLHYIQNNQPCKDGDVVLMDVGAEYANYNGDMTRCVPVNGKFTPRQKQVYNAVLRVMREATKMLKVGNIWHEYQENVGEIMTKELVDLGLLTLKEVKNQDKNKPAYKKYFMHGTSHHLGLDVHDVNYAYRKFEAGMVFTCEPGIYIREENLGIRLENNILITREGNFDLMHNIPIEAEEIESLMNS